MTMKSLISAAQAAGYAMAPSEELFHADDDIACEQQTPREPVHSDAVFHAPVPYKAAPARLPEGWFRGMLTGMLARRATPA